LHPSPSFFNIRKNGEVTLLSNFTYDFCYIHGFKFSFFSSVVAGVIFTFFLAIKPGLLEILKIYKNSVSIAYQM